MVEVEACGAVLEDGLKHLRIEDRRHRGKVGVISSVQMWVGIDDLGAAVGTLAYLIRSSLGLVLNEAQHFLLE